MQRVNEHPRRPQRPGDRHDHAEGVGRTVRLKLTKPNGTVATASAVTDATSSYAVKIPILDSDVGVMNVGVFYDGAGKYGADDAACTATA